MFEAAGAHPARDVGILFTWTASVYSLTIRTPCCWSQLHGLHGKLEYEVKALAEGRVDAVHVAAGNVAALPVHADVGDLCCCQLLPLVLLVHGGPWAHDGFDFNSMHQWLANRGYGILVVNFRGHRFW